MVPIIKEAIHNKEVDDVQNALYPEKKEATPGPPPKVEEDKHLTTTYSLLEGLGPEHLPWSKEVHLVEDVKGVRKTYAAVVVVLRKCVAKRLGHPILTYHTGEIDSTEIDEQDDSKHGLEHPSNADSLAQPMVASAHSIPPPPPRQPETPKWGTPVSKDTPRPPRPF